MLVAIGSIFGPAGVAWSQVAFSLIAFFINAHYTRIHISYGIWAQTMDFFPMLVLASIMAAIVYWAGLVINASLAIELFLQVTFGISFYIAAIYLAKFEALNEIYLIFKRTTQTIQQ